VHVAIRCEEPWCSAEQSEVIVQGWPQLSFVARVALEYPKVAHDTSIHLREPHFPPKLRRLFGLASADYGRVGLENGNQFLGGRKLLSFKHPTAGLPNHLLKELREVPKSFRESPCAGYIFEQGSHPPSLP
jgi:hypothetical protein